MGHEIAQLIQEDSEQRLRLTEGIFVPSDPKQALGRYEKAFTTIKKSQDIERKIRKAIRKKVLPKKRIPAVMDLALEKGVITSDELEIVKLSEALRWDAIQVDEFSEDEFLNATQAHEALKSQKPLDASPDENRESPAVGLRKSDGAPA